ncbi:MAG: biotin synthase BioB [Candidatus Schekmanbacteria bacterium]|nr:biotin synthase BioB [Candidatus Schekmanbacteria bacterium]
MHWDRVAATALSGTAVPRETLLAAATAGDDELLALLDAAFRIRRHFHGRRVSLHVLQNAKSGLCPEDCSFCSQSARAASGVDRYAMQSVDELVAGARSAARDGAHTYCMVTSTRDPSGRELATICEAARRIKSELSIRLCASLGLLDAADALALAAAGLDRYNHNLETSERFFGEVCTTHTYAARVGTVRVAKAAGMEACCGGIVGLGERPEDRVGLALALRELGADSIPVNFLDPRPGTALAGRARLSAAEALRCLAVLRLANPAVDLRVAGGRETVLGRMQPLALFAANSLFTRGYLTTPGQGLKADLEMIAQAGFEVGEVHRQ